MNGAGPDGLVTIDQIIGRARQTLDPGQHTWAAAGAGQEVTLARNAAALNTLALIPHLGRDVSTVDTSVSFAGVTLAFPVVLAPIGALHLYDRDDALASARAAVNASISAFCSILSTARWEEVAATSPGRHFFQLYVLGDRSWIDDVLADVETMGFGGLCVTMDSAVIGRRDRSLENGFIWRTPEEGTVNLADRGWDAAYRARFTWKDLEWMCTRTNLPVIVKGVMSPDDAMRAVDCGASAIYVSNHGGRMVDHALSSIEVLEEIVDVLPDHVDVAIDSGFTRGAEVCKALALGAKAVGIGRLQCWALAVAGTSGLTRLLEILAEEITRTMANLGCQKIEDIGAGHVRWSLPAPPRQEW